MKFYSTDPIFFSDVSEALERENDSVLVGHLKFLEASQESIKKNEWIVTDDSLDAKELVATMFSKGISHFVQKNPGYFMLDLKHAGGLIEAPQSYFESEHSLIEREGFKSTRINFSKPEDKKEMLEKFFSFVDPVMNGPGREAAVAAIEELYMNAIIDAPKESQRQGMKVSTQPCELFLCVNNNTLQISCSDPYGSLDLKKLFGRLDEVYQKGPGAAINLEGSGGAGIGCFMLFEQCRALFFGVVKGVQTKVTCLIPTNLNRREWSKMKKSLHGFEVEK